MPGVCCGCVAKPASVSPRKTYNTLVAALFIGEPIKTTDALDTSLRRKIQKIQEYVQKNPAKIPKVGCGWGCGVRVATGPVANPLQLRAPKRARARGAALLARQAC